MSFYSFMFICKEEPPLHCCNVQSDLSQQEKNQEIGNDGGAEQYKGRCRKTKNKQKGG